MAFDADDKVIGVLPASGWQIGHLDQEGLIFQEPIIGFLIVQTSNAPREGFHVGAWPIAGSGTMCPGMTGGYVLIRPDGVFDLPDECSSFHSVDELNAHLAKRRVSA
jgi:hypothetical protein